MSEASTTRFLIYHLHYKDKLIGNLNQTFVCITNYLYFLFDCDNFSKAFFLTFNRDACAAEPRLFTKKRELLRISLIHKTYTVIPFYFCFLSFYIFFIFSKFYLFFSA